MVNYIVRRMGYALIMLVLVSFASFVIINLPPSDFLTQKLEQLRWYRARHRTISGRGACAL